MSFDPDIFPDLSQCLQRLVFQCENTVDLNAVYDINDNAVIERGTGDPVLLTLYPDSDIDDIRSEMAVTCTMSGTPGFPAVKSMGCDLDATPFIVTTMPDGVRLTEMDFGASTYDRIAGIAVKLLEMLRIANLKTQGVFGMFDLIPDEIYVSAQCTTVSIRVGGTTFSPTCPGVTIGRLRKRLEIREIPPLDTIAFTKRGVGEKDVTKLIKDDFRPDQQYLSDWHIIVTILMSYVTELPVKVCKSPRECLIKNAELFNDAVFSSRRVGGLRPLPSVVDLLELAQGISPPPRPARRVRLRRKLRPSVEIERQESEIRLDERIEDIFGKEEEFIPAETIPKRRPMLTKAQQRLLILKRKKEAARPGRQLLRRGESRGIIRFTPI